MMPLLRYGDLVTVASGQQVQIESQLLRAWQGARFISRIVRDGVEVWPNPPVAAKPEQYDPLESLGRWTENARPRCPSVSFVTDRHQCRHEIGHGGGHQSRCGRFKWADPDAERPNVSFSAADADIYRLFKAVARPGGSRHQTIHNDGVFVGVFRGSPDEIEALRKHWWGFVNGNTQQASLQLPRPPKPVNEQPRPLMSIAYACPNCLSAAQAGPWLEKKGYRSFRCGNGCGWKADLQAAVPVP
ncbi:MAG: hypothetical protein ACYC2H_01375 [Thermoplasmatota archaeon]